MTKKQLEAGLKRLQDYSKSWDEEMPTEPTTSFVRGIKYALILVERGDDDD